MGNSADDKEVQMLKNKNAELQELASALSQNLARKQQSLENALNAIHSLNDAKQKITKDSKHSIEDSKSLTDADILLLTQSNADEEKSEENNMNLLHPRSSDGYDSSETNTDENQIHSS